jgi:predicted lactoylglutathione lyase
MSANQAYVEGFVPFVHVRDVMRSTAFYALFGFEVRHTYEVDGRRVWCWLERSQARLMLAETDAPVVASEQAFCSMCTRTSWRSCTPGLRRQG